MPRYQRQLLGLRSDLPNDRNGVENYPLLMQRLEVNIGRLNQRPYRAPRKTRLQDVGLGRVYRGNCHRRWCLDIQRQLPQLTVVLEVLSGLINDRIGVVNGPLSASIDQREALFAIRDHGGSTMKSSRPLSTDDLTRTNDRNGVVRRQAARRLWVACASFGSGGEAR